MGEEGIEGDNGEDREIEDRRRITRKKIEVRKRRKWNEDKDTYKYAEQIKIDR